MPLISQSINIITLSNGRGVERLFSSLERTQKTSPIYRLIKRKIQKGIDIQNSIIITSTTRINNLQQQVNDSRAQKRRKVQPDPNRAFVTVIEVDNTRRRLEAQLLGTEDVGLIDLSDAEISDSKAIAIQLFGI